MLGFPGGSDSKQSACKAGDLGSVLGWEDTLGEGVAIHSSIIAWEVSWTEEPGRLQFMRLKRVRHDWATEQQQQWHKYSLHLIYRWESAKRKIFSFPHNYIAIIIVQFSHNYTAISDGFKNQIRTSGGLFSKPLQHRTVNKGNCNFQWTNICLKYLVF